MGNTYGYSYGYGMEASKETQNSRHKGRSTRSKKQSTPEDVPVAVPVKNVEIVKQEPQEAEIIKKEEPVVVDVRVKKRFCGDLFKNSYNVMLYDHHVRKKFIDTPERMELFRFRNLPDVPIDKTRTNQYKMTNRNYYGKFPVAKSILYRDSDIVSSVKERYPVIRELDMANIVIAGGSVCNAIVKSGHKSDLDLFVFGLNESDATELVKKTIKRIIVYAYDNKFSYNILRGEHLVKILLSRTSKLFVIEECEIQIIFRLYQTVSEVLYGFDIGSSSVGIHNNRVYSSAIGMYSYRNMLNIYDPTRSSPTYTSRLCKYCWRGFRILFPFLDTFRSFKNAYNNDVSMIDNFAYYNYKCGLWIRQKYLPKNKADRYDSDINTTSISPNISGYGLRSLEPVQKIFMTSVCENRDNILFDKISQRRLLRDIDRVITRLFDKPISSRRYYSELRNISITTLVGTFTLEESIDMVTAIKEALDSGDKLENHVLRRFMRRFIDNFRRKLDEYNDRVDLNSVCSKIVWKTDNPGEQLTSTLFPRDYSLTGTYEEGSIDVTFVDSFKNDLKDTETVKNIIHYEIDSVKMDDEPILTED